MTQELGQGGAFCAFGHVVGQGMQADVVLAAVNAVEGVEAAAGIVPLEDEDLLAREGQTDPGGKPGHAGADDDGFKVLVVESCGWHF